MEINWWEQLILLGSLQGFLLAIVIGRKKNTNPMARNFLISLLILTSLVLVGRVFYKTKYLQVYWVVYTYTDIIIFLFGPLIYLFINSLLGRKLPPKSKLIWHFLPALIHLFVINTFLSLGILGKITFFTNLHFLMVYAALELMAIISLGIYLWKSVVVFSQYELAYFDSFSQPVIHSFLKDVLYFFLLILSVWGVSFLLKSFRVIPDNVGIVYYGFWTLVAVSTYLLSYKVLLNPKILNAPKVPSTDSSDEKGAVEIIISTAILDAKNQLSNFLTTSKIYKNPNLSLDDLAKATQMNRHELSKVINQGYRKNFFDLINSYRIQAFIEKYEPKNTFLEVAFEVGFNSKSAFNRAFRKETGTNPSTFFKSQTPLQKANS